MAILVSINEAEALLDELVEASLRGEEVILSEAGRPLARITALDDSAADYHEPNRAELGAGISEAKGLARSSPNSGE